MNIADQVVVILHMGRFFPDDFGRELSVDVEVDTCTEEE